MNVRDGDWSRLVGQYIDRHGDENAEQAATNLIGGSLNSWTAEMAVGDDAIGTRRDGSELRADDLRLPKLAAADRSEATQQEPLMHVAPGERADVAVRLFHNLMKALNAMVMADDRSHIRLHLTAEFVLIRALIEAATTALWILGPDDGDIRIQRSLRLQYSELDYARLLTKKFTDLSLENTSEENERDALTEAREAQLTYISGQLDDLRLMAERAGVAWSMVKEPANPQLIAREAGVFVPGYGPALTYWYWSTASSIAHGEPVNMRRLGDSIFVGVDSRDEPVAHLDPSATTIWKHLEAALKMILAAHELWNRRAFPPDVETDQGA